MDKHERVARELWHSCALPETAWMETASETLRKNYPDEPKRGTCGECRESEAQTEATTNTERGQTMFESVRCKEWGWRFPIDCSCPRFERREDKAARLARELADIADTVLTDSRGEPCTEEDYCADCGALVAWGGGEPVVCVKCHTRHRFAKHLRANGVEGE